MLERDSVMTCLPGRPRSSAASRRRLAQEGRQAGEIRLAVEHERGRRSRRPAHSAQNCVPSARQPLGDRGEPRLRLRLELRAGAHEGGVVAVEDAGLLGGRGRGCRACRTALDPRV